MKPVHSQEAEYLQQAAGINELEEAKTRIRCPADMNNAGG